MTIELREYQEKQLEFLTSMASSSSNELFEANCSLESPTGSGKSIVMMEFIKRMLEAKPKAKVFISTGFNDLVFQLHETALEMGLPSTVLIGRNHTRCLKKAGFSASEQFTIDEELNPKGEYECIACEMHGKECPCDYALREISQSPSGVLVITNHSTLIARMGFFSEHFIGGFIDECQTFGAFYEGAMQARIPYNELNTIRKFVSNDLIAQSNAGIEAKTLEWEIKAGKVTQETLDKVLRLPATPTPAKIEARKQTYVSDYFPRSERECTKMRSYKDLPHYTYPQIEYDKKNGIIIDYFFTNVELPFNVCLVSATVDTYTTSMMKVGKGNSYKETSCRIIDYSKSSVSVYNEFADDAISNFIKKQEGNRGLLLSTRLDIVDAWVQKGEVCGYEIIDDASKLEDGKKQILVGSRKLFQGIDIHGLDFILLNRLPFDPYTNAYKAKMAYFDSTGVKSYEWYTIPHVVNSLIQAMGRGWRRPDDKCNIGIFDGRALVNHKKILKDALSYRKGIKVFRCTQ